jgi:hypothetical protein
MLRYVNAAQRQIVAFKPTSNVITSGINLSAGDDVRQTLPAGGIKFIKASSSDSQNEMPTGSGNMTEIEMDALSSLFPEWSYTQVEQPRTPNPQDVLQDPNNDFQHYMHDPREPKVFWIFPPPKTSGSVGGIDVTYVDLPTDLGALGSTFALDDQYQNAAVLYVMYRCLRKDGRHGGGVALRTSMWQDFRSALGMQAQSEERVSPEQPRSAPPTGKGQ